MKVFCGDSALNFTALNDSGINAGMIIALNIRVESIAVCGLCKCITLSNCIFGFSVMNIAGSSAKYLAASLAILNVVMAPRVINNCFPSLTTFKIFDGSESRSTILLLPWQLQFHCSLLNQRLL